MNHQLKCLLVLLWTAGDAIGQFIDYSAEQSAVIDQS